MTYEPDLVPAYLPSPRVQVTFDSLAPGTVTVTVWRRSDVTVTVPGAVGVFAAGGVTVADVWAPHSVEVTYWAEMFDGTGTSLGLTGAASTTVWGERGVVWVSDPYVPDNAVGVEMGASFGEKLTTSQDVALYNIGGRVVSLHGPAGLYAGVDLSLRTDTQEQADILLEILNTGLVLYRAAPFIRPGFPTVFYAATRYDVVDAPHLGGFQFGGTSALWEGSGDQVSPIAVGAAVSVLPYQVYMDAFATYQDAMDVYGTYLDARRNPPGGV